MTLKPLGSWSLRPASFLRNVLIAMSWSIVAQAISTASMPILSRLFSPTQFGVFAVFTGLVVMIGIVAAGRYDFAIGLPESDADAAAVFTLCVGLASATCLWCLLASHVLPIAALFPKLSPLTPWWFLVSLSAAIIGWYSAASYMALRQERFGAVGRTKVVMAVVTAAGQIAGGIFLSRGAGTLIWAFSAGQLVGTLLLIQALSDHSLWQFNPRTLRSAAARYVRFPQYVAPGSFLDGLAALLPVATISAFYSPAEAGIYALADRALRAPVSLVGSSVHQVFYQRIATLRSDPNAGRKLMLRTWVQLGGIALLPSLALALFGRAIFTFLFGSAWGTSGHVAETMALSMFLFFISSPTSSILVVQERTRSFLFWQTAQAVMMGGALWCGTRGPHPTLRETVAWIVAAQTSACLLSLALQWSAVANGTAALSVATERRL